MTSLNYATSGGRLYNAIGWFNFASLPVNVSVTNNTSTPITLSNDIKGGGSITATFTLSRVGTAGNTTTFAARVPPASGGATFGRTAYLGLTQKVCLQDIVDVSSPNFGIINVSNVSIVNRYGQAINNYNFYFMDSETPQAAPSNETFTTNGSPWSIFYVPPATPTDPNCTLSGIGTTIVNTVGQGNMPLLLTTNPTGIIQTVTGGGAMSFGVSITTAELRKVVTNRIDPSDQFQLDIIGVNSGTTITQGQNNGLQLQGVQVISGDGGQSVFTFNESMAQGSSSNLSLYNPVVQVSNLTAGGTVLPSTINLGASLTLNIGDYALVTIVNTPSPTNVKLNKTVDKDFCDLGDRLTYTLVCTNQSQYPIRNVIITDTIPINSTLDTQSVTLNGVPISQSPEPPIGISVGTLDVGGAATITFQVLVTNTLPSPNNIINNSTATFLPAINIGAINSQAVVTTINTAIITAQKFNDKVFADIGNIITYTVTFKNKGTVTANNILFIDTIPNGTSLVLNSYKQDNTLILGTPNYPGVTLPNNISVGNTSTITFQVKVNTLPVPNPILNSASSTFSYTVSQTNSNIKSVNTNTVSTQINTAILSGITKFTDKSFANCNETINYTIVIPNTGNITAQNIIFKDTIPNGTMFIDNSVLLNGVQQIGINPENGINIPNIGPGANASVTFKVKVVC